MASENAPVLFPARLAKGTPRPYQGHSASTKTLTAQLVQTIAATLSSPDALPPITELMGLQLGADACLILRYHCSTKSLFYTFWQTGNPAQAWMLPCNAASPRAELQCRAACSLIHHGTSPSNEPGSLLWQEHLATLLEETKQSLPWIQNIQTCHTIPIDTAPDIEGIVLLLHTPENPPKTLDEPQKIEIAGLLAIALHQHHLQYQTQRSNEQLTYLNYLKEDFLSTLNHELRTPLTSMMLAIRMLRRPDLTPERAAMYLDILEQQCAREINLVNDLLMLQSMGGKTPKQAAETTDLAQLLTQVTDREAGQFRGSALQLQLDVPGQPVIMATSSERLARVVQELLTNACKYAAPYSTVTVRLTDELIHHQSVKLSITNTGAGISPEEVPHVFEKFRRGKNATKNAVPGTGTGLAIVKGLVEQLGGTITVTSNPLDRDLWETCFIIELTIAKEPAKCS